MRLFPPFAVVLSAALVLPVAAGAQNRPVPPDTARVRLESGTDAYVAYPAGRKSGPAVIVVHEWWGLNAQIRDVARRLAQQGYVAVVPDLYHGKVAETPEQAHVLMRAVDEERTEKDVDAALAWLRSEPRVGKGRVGVIGFCMGGSIALRYALERPELAAAVIFYGSPVTDAGKLEKLEVPVQAHFGGKDEGIPADRIAAFRAALTKLGKSSEVYVYPSADHAFMNDRWTSYHADAARQAWTRALAFFQKYLKA